MKLIAGYQLRPDARLVDKLIEHSARVGEVYFAWPGVANGRSAALCAPGLAPWVALERQRADLKRLSDAGIRLNLLLNGNCYGAESLARSFYQQLGDLIDALVRTLRLDSVTTASPVIAKFIKQNFEALELRASVNMEIGTREGVEYLADRMDGFYVKREWNRSIERVRAFSEICRSMGKKVYLLANSGCLNYCSARTFHDNLVSHEQELIKFDNAYRFDGLCREFLADPQKQRRILEISNWIRPEDLERYDALVDGAKLATRVSAHPEMIVEAYATGRFSGNLLELTEPDLSALFRPAVLDAGRMPPDYFKRRSRCTQDCAHCGYCTEVYDRAQRLLTDEALF